MATEKCGIDDEDDSCNLSNPTKTDIVLNLKKRFERGQIYVSSIFLFIFVFGKREVILLSQEQVFR